MLLWKLAVCFKMDNIYLQLLYFQEIKEHIMVVQWFKGSLTTVWKSVGSIVGRCTKKMSVESDEADTQRVPAKKVLNFNLFSLEWTMTMYILLVEVRLYIVLHARVEYNVVNICTNLFNILITLKDWYYIKSIILVNCYKWAGYVLDVIVIFHKC